MRATLMNKFLIIFLLLCSPAWGGVEFDNTDDGLCLEDPVGFPNITHTAIAIMKPVGSDLDYFLHHVERNGANSGYSYAVEEDGDIFHIGWGVGTATCETINVPDNEWSCVGVARDKTANTLDCHVLVYSTGVFSSEQETSVSDFVSLSSDADFSIGFSNPGATNTCSAQESIGGVNFFNGDISEVAFFSDVKTAAEVEAYCRSQSKRIGLQYSNLLGLWPMDGIPEGESGDGQLFRDISGNGYHLTGYGGAGVAEQVLSYP